MERKYWFVFLVSVVLFTSCSLSPEVPYAFTYVSSGSGVSIVGFTGELPADLVIPSEINSKTVVSIANYAFCDCTNLKSVSISNGVTAIYIQAFSGCTGLTAATLPASLDTLGVWAFENCSNLASVTVHALKPPAWDGGVFNGCAALAAIRVPAAGVDAYKVASGWDYFASIIVAQ